MFKNHIKISIRNLWKNKLLSSLNLIGLSIGIGSVLTLIFTVYSYYSADAPVKDQENIYYLKTILKNGDSYSQAVHPLLEEIVKTVPDVVATTHIQGWGQPWLQYGETEFQERTDYVDTTFFEVFSLPLKYGDVETALKKKHSVILTEEVSQKIFGKKNPVGALIKVDDTINLTVTGVLSPISPYSTFRFGVLFPMALLEDNASFMESANWDNTFGPSYLRVLPTADIAQMESQIREVVKKNYLDPSNISEIRAIPFANFRTDAIPIVNTIINGSIAASFFVLLIILVNLLNLNSSTMFGRTKDIAVRKILGGSKKSVIVQFCIENGILVFTSLMISGTLFLIFLLPKLNDVFGSSFGKITFDFKKDYPVIIYAVILGLMITLIVGTLPALRFISAPISNGIKGKINTIKSNFFVRNSFMTLQFVIAIIFICVAIILNNQISFMKSAPLGFNGKNVTVGKIDLEFKDNGSATSKFNALMDELKANPFVKGISTSQVVPSQYPFNYTAFYESAIDGEIRFRYARTDEGYLKTLSIPVAMGRDFNKDLDNLEEGPVIINRTAMKALGWNDIEGKRLKRKVGEGPGHQVVGVMEDFHYQDMQLAVEPLVHFYGGATSLANNRFLTVNVAEGHEKAVQQQITDRIAKMNSRRNYEYDFLNNKVSAQYNLMEGILRTVNVVALLTIFISCLGMFGLISFMAKRRIKEIGIRKVLGAGIFKIVLLLSTEYLVLTTVAAIIAIPIAWYVMNEWLSGFAYSITIQWWMFALAGSLGLAITAFTVGIQSIKSAVANPLKSLLTE